jgi:hypothetical protein
VTKPFAGYWMKSAYRIPNGKFPIVQHFLSQMAAANEPITDMVINSDHGAHGRHYAARWGECRYSRRRLGRRLWHSACGNLD